MLDVLNFLVSELYMLHYFLPFPFMLLYYLKTPRLEILHHFTAVFAVAFSLYVISTPRAFLPPPLILSYVAFGIVGILIFKRKYHFPQAVSLVFNTISLNLLYWEFPYFVYATVKRGYISDAVILHVLPIFSFYFLLTVLALKKNKTNIFLLLIGLLSSITLMAMLLLSKVDVLTYVAYLGEGYWMKEITYTLARSICLTMLYYIVYNSQPRKAEYLWIKTND